MVADGNFLVGKAYATYSNNCQQLPHAGHTVTAVLHKNGQTTTQPKVYPCSKMPLISAFGRGRNGASHESEANTEVQGDAPTSPKSRACHGTSGQTERKLRETEARFLSLVPSATTLNISRTCLASKGQLEDSSSTSRGRIIAPDRGSFPRDTAAPTVRWLCCPHAMKRSRPSRTGAPNTKKREPTPKRPCSKTRER